MKKKKKIEKKLSIEEVRELVFEIANGCLNLAHKRLKDVDRKAAWIIWGRALNALFSHHYGMSMGAAEKRLENEEKKG